MSLARTLARHTIDVPPLPPPVQDWMRHLLMDYYTVTVGGTDRHSAAAARASAALSEEPDELRCASLHGISAWATVEEAALVNGITAHGLELDDTYEQASSHPGVAIFPAVLAIADAQGESAGKVLQATTVGYDVMCALGVLVGPAESYARGFHPTGITGAVGATAAVCSIMDLGEERTTHALGLAADMASGSLEFLSDGSWTKRLNAGQAAATGIRAARLAAAGFTAPATSLEGRDGFLRQYGQGQIPGRTLHLELGRGALETSIKFYPCCRYMHGNIDLLIALRREMPELSLKDIESIEVAVIKAGAALVAVPAERKRVITTSVDAQFSMPFGAAVALATGAATVEQFDRAAAVADELRPWIEKVRCYESEDLEAAYPAAWQAEVRLRLKDGNVIDKSTGAFRGSPPRRASRDDLEAKASQLIGPDAARLLAASVFDMVLSRPLAEQVDLSALNAMAPASANADIRAPLQGVPRQSPSMSNVADPLP
ncbi:MmgE/PrpD family protein [Citricoccus sp. NPDC055426]|uniref:MmgE/PrpD family protein n=1 Tax=Citricoccus sp. NPDC055426 TaxID=3155536 RepID=UPI0034187AA0